MSYRNRPWLLSQLVVMCLIAGLAELKIVSSSDGQIKLLQRRNYQISNQDERIRRSSTQRVASTGAISDFIRNPKERLRQLPSSRRTLYPPPSNLWHINERLFEKQKSKGDLEGSAKLLDASQSMTFKKKVVTLTPEVASHRDSTDSAQEDLRIRLDPTDFQRKDRPIRYRKVLAAMTRNEVGREMPSQLVNRYYEEDAGGGQQIRHDGDLPEKQAAVAPAIAQDSQPLQEGNGLQRIMYSSSKRVSYPSPRIGPTTGEVQSSVAGMAVHMQKAMQSVQEAHAKMQEAVLAQAMHNTNEAESFHAPASSLAVNSPKEAAEFQGRLGNSDHGLYQQPNSMPSEASVIGSDTEEAPLTPEASQSYNSKGGKESLTLTNPSPDTSSEPVKSEFNDASLIASDQSYLQAQKSKEMSSLPASSNQDQAFATDATSELVPVSANDFVMSPASQDSKPNGPVTSTIGSGLQQNGVASDLNSPSDAAQAASQVRVDSEAFDQTPQVSSIPLSTFANPATGEVQNVGLPMNSEDIPLSSAVASAAAQEQSFDGTPGADCLGQPCSRQNLASVSDGSYVVGSPTDFLDYGEWPSGVNPGAQFSNHWNSNGMSRDPNLARGRIHPNQLVYVKQNGVLNRVHPDLFLKTDPASHAEMRMERLGNKQPTLTSSSLLSDSSDSATSRLHRLPALLTVKHHKPAGPSIAFETHIPGLTRALHSWSKSKSQSSANSSSASNANSNANSISNTKTGQNARTQTTAGSKADQAKDGYGYGQGSGYGYGSTSWGWGGGGGWSGKPPPDGFPKLPTNYGQPPNLPNLPQFPNAGAPAQPPGWKVPPQVQAQQQAKPKPGAKDKARKVKEKFLKGKKISPNAQDEITNIKLKPGQQIKVARLGYRKKPNGAIIRQYTDQVEGIGQSRDLLLKKFSDYSHGSQQSSALEFHRRLH